MDIYQRIATDTTPAVYFNPDTGESLIEGKSILNDADDFFTPILAWLDEYVKKTNVKTTFKMKLQYFNVSSSKRLLFMFYKLNMLADINKPVVIKWYYVEDDAEMFEVGQDFAFMVNVPFNFLEYDPYTVAVL